MNGFVRFMTGLKRIKVSSEQGKELLSSKLPSFLKIHSMSFHGLIPATSKVLLPAQRTFHTLDLLNESFEFFSVT